EAAAPAVNATRAEHRREHPVNPPQAARLAQSADPERAFLRSPPRSGSSSFATSSPPASTQTVRKIADSVIGVRMSCGRASVTCAKSLRPEPAPNHRLLGLESAETPIGTVSCAMDRQRSHRPLALALGVSCVLLIVGTCLGGAGPTGAWAYEVETPPIPDCLFTGAAEKATLEAT